MSKVSIAGLKIDVATKSDFLSQILLRIRQNQKTWVITPYSEFLYHALRDNKLMETLNQADYAVADGIGIFWAKKYLELPLTAQNFYGKIFQALWQIKYSLLAIVFNPKWIKSALPEKIPGSDLIWDLAKLASDNNFSIYLLGGFNDTPELVARNLKIENLKLKIVGASNKHPDDPSLYDDIKNASPDILLVAYGPIKQERWIAENLPNLPVKLAIGLGGTFDYLAGKVPLPPKIMRAKGLEWLWRLFTQPKRITRIFNATFGLIQALLRYKVFISLPYRKNEVSVVINNEGKILIGLRSQRDKLLKDVGETDAVKMNNYWQLSQGGVDDGEDLEVAAKRELYEELRIKNVKLIKISSQTFCYDWPEAKRPALFNSYKFRGQEQHIVYFKFLGLDNEIIPDEYEFSETKWVSPENLATEVHPEKAPLAKIIQADLKEMQEKAII
ncbi:MAG: WecB/TagA/CpsF family glycosyltransferase [Candidatus Doudnabacteria bacterium]|jgi:N-acetylglucosaminyldiphosphoundecaprenol N-acetyl-beta-D-mannosaminyltransferase